MRILNESKIDVNYQNDESGRSLLHESIAHDSFVLVKKLLDLKAEVNVLNRANNTPLHLSVRDANSEMIEYLLNSKAGWTFFFFFKNLNQTIIFSNRYKPLQ